MATATDAPAVFCFDCFELDLATGRLSKRGTRIKLRDKCFQVLACFLEHPGQVVTREELQDRLWPDGVFVDVENNLNTTIAKLREALGDSADHPRFIETITKRGYRFIAPVSLMPRVADRQVSSRIRVLVLPLIDASNDGAEYLTDAVTANLIAELSRIAPAQLGVIARTTAMHYKGTRKELAQIGRELGVDYIVEGMVRREADQQSINVQLTRRRDQTQVWAERYAPSRNEMPGAERAIAQAIAAQLGMLSVAAASGRPRRTHTADIAAYNDFVRGWSCMATGTPDGLREATRHFERAARRDPQFALAYDALAEIYWFLGYFGFLPPKEAFSTGVLFAMRALEIDTTLAETHALLGQYHKQLHYDWPEVEREMRRALQLDPTSPVVRVRYAFNFLMPHSRFAEAITELEYALDWDPLSPYARTVLAVILLLSRRYDRAAEEAHLLLEIEPSAYWAYNVIASCYREKRLFDDAIRAQRKATELSGGSSIMLGWLGLVLALAGNTGEARSLLRELHERALSGYVPPASIAWIHVGLREFDEAFVWLDRAVDGLDQMMMPIKSYPFLDPIRSDLRFRALLRKMNLDR